MNKYIITFTLEQFSEKTDWIYDVLLQGLNPGERIKINHLIEVSDIIAENNDTFKTLNKRGRK